MRKFDPQGVLRIVEFVSVKKTTSGRQAFTQCTYRGVGGWRAGEEGEGGGRDAQDSSGKAYTHRGSSYIQGRQDGMGKCVWVCPRACLCTLHSSYHLPSYSPTHQASFRSPRLTHPQLAPSNPPFSPMSSLFVRLRCLPVCVWVRVVQKREGD